LAKQDDKLIDLVKQNNYIKKMIAPLEVVSESDPKVDLPNLDDIPGIGPIAKKINEVGNSRPVQVFRSVNRLSQPLVEGYQGLKMVGT
jgi:hypothetical protein